MCRPWFRHCQSAFVALVLVLVVVGGWILWQNNQRGFQGRWANEMQAQLAARGLDAEFSSTRLSLSQGLVIRDLRVFAKQDRDSILLSADKLVLDVDRHHALRGEWEVRSLNFENLSVRLPEAFTPHHLTSFYGQFSLSRDRELVLSETQGNFGKLSVSLDASLRDFEFSQLLSDREPPDFESIMATAHREISNWSTTNETPAHLAVEVAGDLAHLTTLQTTFAFRAPQLTRNSYAMSNLVASGSYIPSSLVVDGLAFEDSEGAFVGKGIYRFLNREVTFEADSTTSLDRLLQDGLEVDALADITLRKAPKIRAKGTVTFPQTSSPVVSLTGALFARDFHYLENDWASLNSDFSWQNGDLYLRDLDLQAESGRLTGELLFQNEVVRYQAKSTLPLKRFQPFIKKGTPLEDTFAKIKSKPDSKVEINLRGSIRPSRLTDWSASGTAVLENISYNQVPLLSASGVFNLTPLQSIYTEPEVEFDLRKDPSFRRFGGPESAVVRAESIVFDATGRTLRIDHLRGVCWPSSVLRPFIPKVAEYLEDTYRATEPPSFSSSGIIDFDPKRAGTSFLTRLESAAPLYYDLLGQSVAFRETSALIHTHHRQVDVSELSSYVFSGPVKGSLTVLLPQRKNQSPDFRGSLLWTRLRLADIGASFDFDKVEKGLVSGRLDFAGTSGRVQTLNGVGNIGLEKGELFKAPVFGPLSPLIAGIQGSQKASHETARDASASFLIRDGILLTDDFITSTDSLTVQAEGSIDLARKTLDMTARADTKGLLKLVTLPINIGPLSGLFQFHGTGSVLEPKWENTPFLQQNRKKADPLFAPPPKARIVPE